MTSLKCFLLSCLAFIVLSGCGVDDEVKTLPEDEATAAETQRRVDQMFQGDLNLQQQQQGGGGVAKP